MADKTIPALKILRGNVGISTASPAVKLHVEGNDIRVNTEGSYQAKTLYFRYSSGAAINSDSYLTLGTGGSPAERMRVVSNGNIGIATTTPGAKLDVNGSAIFRGAAGWAGNDSQACAIYLNTAGRGVMGNFSNYARNLVKANSNYVEVGQNSTLVYGIKFRVGSNAPNGFMFESNIGGTMTTHMSIRGDTGRVGIGTNAPGDVLHVDGNTIIGDTDRQSVVLTLKAQNTAGAPAATTQIRMKGYEGRGIGTFYEDSSYSGKEWFCGMNYSAAFGYWNVGYDASGGQAEYNANTLFRVKYDGSVDMLNYGSGTFTGTAAYKLAVDSSGNIIETAVGAGQVDGSGTANKIALWTDPDTIGDSIITQSGTAYAQVNGGVRITGNHTDTGSQLNIWCDNSGHARAAAYDYFFYSGSNNSRSNLALFLKTDGNVGVGTANPPHKLSIYGTGAGKATVQIEGEGGADPYINFLVNNTTHWAVGADDNRGDCFKISQHSALGTNDFFAVRTDGKVGIGTDDPAYKLDVYGGDARIGTNLRLGNGSAAGNSTNPAITVSAVNTAGSIF